jgi:hypothetical protein
MASSSKKNKTSLDDLLSGEMPQGIIRRGPGLRTSVNDVPVMPDIEEKPKEPKLLKRSVYLTSEQDKKLDELARQHRHATGAETNRMDVVRMLVDGATLDTLLQIEKQSTPSTQ